jgi:DtxR family Mn-dependent transcriptional regulator
MIRSHRIWEVFLEKYLGYSWEEVHHEAEHLEHAGSEKMIEKMYELIGKPETCQHGNPIPSYDTIFKIKNYPSLFDMEEGVVFQILQVKDDYGLLQYLKQHHIHIQDAITIIKKYPSLSQIEIKHQENTYHMSEQTAKMIFGNNI